MSARATILVIEDEAPIRRGIVDALKFEGYAALESADGESGLKSALHADADLILLDLNLPGLPGIEILKEVRRARPSL